MIYGGASEIKIGNLNIVETLEEKETIINTKEVTKAMAVDYHSEKIGEKNLYKELTLKFSIPYTSENLVLFNDGDVLIDSLEVTNLLKNFKVIVFNATIVVSHNIVFKNDKLSSIDFECTSLRSENLDKDFVITGIDGVLDTDVILSLSEVKAVKGKKILATSQIYNPATGWRTTTDVDFDYLENLDFEFELIDGKNYITPKKVGKTSIRCLKGSLLSSWIDVNVLEEYESLTLEPELSEISSALDVIVSPKAFSNSAIGTVEITPDFYEITGVNDSFLQNVGGNVFSTNWDFAGTDGAARVRYSFEGRWSNYIDFVLKPLVRLRLIPYTTYRKSNETIQYTAQEWDYSINNYVDISNLVEWHLEGEPNGHTISDSGLVQLDSTSGGNYTVHFIYKNVKSTVSNLIVTAFTYFTGFTSPDYGLTEKDLVEGEKVQVAFFQNYSTDNNFESISAIQPDSWIITGNEDNHFKIEQEGKFLNVSYLKESGNITIEGVVDGVAMGIPVTITSTFNVLFSWSPMVANVGANGSQKFLLFAKQSANEEYEEVVNFDRIDINFKWSTGVGTVSKELLFQSSGAGGSFNNIFDGTFVSDSGRIFDIPRDGSPTINVIGAPLFDVNLLGAIYEGDLYNRYAYINDPIKFSGYYKPHDSTHTEYPSGLDFEYEYSDDIGVVIDEEGNLSCPNLGTTTITVKYKGFEAKNKYTVEFIELPRLKAEFIDGTTTKNFNTGDLVQIVPKYFNIFTQTWDIYNRADLEFHIETDYPNVFSLEYLRHIKCGTADGIATAKAFFTSRGIESEKVEAIALFTRLFRMSPQEAQIGALGSQQFSFWKKEAIDSPYVLEEDLSKVDLSLVWNNIGTLSSDLLFESNGVGAVFQNAFKGNYINDDGTTQEILRESTATMSIVGAPIFTLNILGAIYDGDNLTRKAYIGDKFKIRGHFQEWGSNHTEHPEGEELEYEFSNDLNVTMDEEGYLSCLNLGTTVISVKYKGFYSQEKITIEFIELPKLRVVNNQGSTSSTIQQGGEQLLFAEYLNTETQTWESYNREDLEFVLVTSDHDCFSIYKNTVFCSFDKDGAEAKIHCTSRGVISEDYTIKVTSTSFTIKPTETVVFNNQTIQFKAEKTENGVTSVIDASELTWDLTLGYTDSTINQDGLFTCGANTPLDNYDNFVRCVWEIPNSVKKISYSDVSVIEEPYVYISPENANVLNGTSLKLVAMAENKITGIRTALPDESVSFEFSTTGDGGTLTEDGIFTATKDVFEEKIITKFNGLTSLNESLIKGSRIFTDDFKYLYTELMEKGTAQQVRVTSTDLDGNTDIITNHCTFKVLTPNVISVSDYSIIALEEGDYEIEVEFDNNILPVTITGRVREDFVHELDLRPVNNKNTFYIPENEIVTFKTSGRMYFSNVFVDEVLDCSYEIVDTAKTDDYLTVKGDGFFAKREDGESGSVTIRSSSKVDSTIFTDREYQVRSEGINLITVMGGTSPIGVEEGRQKYNVGDKFNLISVVFHNLDGFLEPDSYPVNYEFEDGAFSIVKLPQGQGHEFTVLKEGDFSITVFADDYISSDPLLIRSKTIHYTTVHTIKPLDSSDIKIAGTTDVAFKIEVSFVENPTVFVDISDDPRAKVFGYDTNVVTFNKPDDYVLRAQFDTTVSEAVSIRVDFDTSKGVLELDSPLGNGRTTFLLQGTSRTMNVHLWFGDERYTLSPDEYSFTLEDVTPNEITVSTSANLSVRSYSNEGTTGTAKLTVTSIQYPELSDFGFIGSHGDNLENIIDVTAIPYLNGFSRGQVRKLIKINASCRLTGSPVVTKDISLEYFDVHITEEFGVNYEIVRNENGTYVIFDEPCAPSIAITYSEHTSSNITISVIEDYIVSVEMTSPDTDLLIRNHYLQIEGNYTNFFSGLHAITDYSKLSIGSNSIDDFSVDIEGKLRYIGSTTSEDGFIRYTPVIEYDGERFSSKSFAIVNSDLNYDTVESRVETFGLRILLDQTSIMSLFLKTLYGSAFEEVINEESSFSNIRIYDSFGVEFFDFTIPEDSSYPNRTIHIASNTFDRELGVFTLTCDWSRMKPNGEIEEGSLSEPYEFLVIAEQVLENLQITTQELNGKIYIFPYLDNEGILDYNHRIEEITLNDNSDYILNDDNSLSIKEEAISDDTTEVAEMMHLKINGKVLNVTFIHTH